MKPPCNLKTQVDFGRGPSARRRNSISKRTRCSLEILKLALLSFQLRLNTRRDFKTAFLTSKLKVRPAYASFYEGIIHGVAACFVPWRVRPHIDRTSDQVLKIYLFLTEKNRRHFAHDETKPHKTCLFLVL